MHDVNPPLLFGELAIWAIYIQDEKTVQILSDS